MEYLTAGLNITEFAKEIAEKIYQTQDSDFFDAGLKRIADNVIENYDDFAFAGRLTLYKVIRSVPSVRTYVALNHNILSDHVKEFMLNYADAIDNYLADKIHLNYEGQDYFSAETMRKMYLIRAIHTKNPTETPLYHNLRIAVQLYYDEGLEEVFQCMDILNDQYATHATPTKTNAGTKDCQMASCFLLNVNDDLESMIYTGVGDMAMISRHSGGIGIGLNRIRHSDIGGLGNSSGVLPYSRVVDKVVGYVDQARKRRGAATGFLNIWHIDVMDFIRAPSNYVPQDMRLIDLTPCIWMHDLFYERVTNDQDWTLFCPNTVKRLQNSYGKDFEKIYLEMEELAPQREADYLNAEYTYDTIRKQISESENPSVELQQSFVEATEALNKSRKAKIVYKTVKAQEISKLISDTQLKSGKPYVMNGDRCNAKSNQQNIGKINNSNLCVEIVQYSDPETFSSCNLASINLPRYAIGRFNNTLENSSDEVIMEALGTCFDFTKLSEITRHVVRNLNKVIDHNFYIFDDSKIKDFNLATRPLGIGVSGLDDIFKEVDIVYGSKASILLNKMIFACMYYNALVESNNLAIKHGEYHHFRTGSCQIYDHLGNDFKEYQGSPLANGFFQFDLWEAEYQYDKSLNRVNYQYYDPKDNIPVDPKYFGGSKSWDQLRECIVQNGVRNSLLLAIMPTASTAQVFRNAESCEAHQSNIYSRQVGIGSFTIVNRHLHADLERISMNRKEVTEFIYENKGLLDGIAEFCLDKYQVSDDVYSRLQFLEKKYQCMFQIKPSLFLQMARHRGIYIDQSQSTNIYIRNPSIAQLTAINMVGNHLKLKTLCYYIRMELSSSYTGFNKEIKNEATEEEFPACRIDDPDCKACGA